MSETRDIAATAKPDVTSRHRLMIVSVISYLTFCSVVFTPLDDLVIYWPYPLFIATQSFTGLSSASAFDYIVADALGLCVVVLTCLAIRRYVGKGRPSWLLAIGVGVWVWIIPLAALQALTWLVCIHLLGGRNL